MADEKPPPHGIGRKAERLSFSPRNVSVSLPLSATSGGKNAPVASMPLAVHGGSNFPLLRYVQAHQEVFAPQVDPLF